MITSDMYYRSETKGIEYWPMIDQILFLPGILITIDGKGVCELWPYHDSIERINKFELD